MHLGIMHFLSLIEIHLLKVTEISLSIYERGHGAKNCEQFLVSKVEFIVKISQRNKNFTY